MEGPWTSPSSSTRSRRSTARDRARGVDGTFRWWVEEVGEVAKALRGGDPAALEHELGDALAAEPRPTPARSASDLPLKMSW
jgi:MazG nucleotide pyrophosphohydrolase domain